MSSSRYPDSFSFIILKAKILKTSIKLFYTVAQIVGASSALIYVKLYSALKTLSAKCDPFEKGKRKCFHISSLF